MRNKGASEDDIKKFVGDIDSILQSKLQEGVLNESDFGKNMKDAILDSIFNNLPILRATISILVEKEYDVNLGNLNEFIEKVASGKIPLPPDIQNFYNTVKQEVLYDELSKLVSPGSGGGGENGGGFVPEPDENKKLVDKKEDKLTAYNDKTGAEVSSIHPALSDVSGHWAKKSIQKLVYEGIIGGYPDKTFRPNNQITRAEFTNILVKSRGFAIETPASPSFKDVAESSWAYGMVEAAVKAGLVKGSEGKFRPGDSITRQEVAVMLVRLMDKESLALTKENEKPDFTDALKIAPWARGHVAVAAEEGLIKGYPGNTFGPQKNSTRAEAVVMICRLLKL